jgi:hypothetical protein
VCLAFPAATPGAATGNTFSGGTNAERQTVASALEASTFDWSVLPRPITVHITRGVESHSTPRDVWLDANLLDAGEFAWGVVQHEFAHQVAFYLLNDAQQLVFEQALGGSDWCYSVAGLPHSDYGCERFASTLAWAYWQSPQNAMRPTSPRDESAAMTPQAFRALLARIVGPAAR